MKHSYLLRRGISACGLLFALGLTACSPESKQQTASAEIQAASAASQRAASAAPQVIGPEGELLKKAQGIFKPLPSFAEAVAGKNITDAQIKLGQELYFDPRLSKHGNQSCNSCHGLAGAGVDNLPTSPGSNLSPGTRNSPTVLNASLQTSQFWDGRAKDLAEQASGPLINPIEMGLDSHQQAVDIVKSIPGYVQEFEQAFADKEVSIKNITAAIAAFEETLLTPSPWDDYLKGNVNALNEQQRTGLRKFMDNGCIACHNGVNLGGSSFQKFGLAKGPYWEYTGSKNTDHGIFDLTKKEADMDVFRVSGLRNVAETAPYFHDGSVYELDKAIKIMGITQLGKELSDEDVKDIAAFLKSTTGKLPESARKLPQLPVRGENTPKPVAVPKK